MQAIRTRYHGPGNVRGSRVKATAQARALTIGWDSSLNSERNHMKAAQALASAMGWQGTWVGGGLPDGSTAWVCIDPRDAFTIEPKPHQVRA